MMQPGRFAILLAAAMVAPVIGAQPPAARVNAEPLTNGRLSPTIDFEGTVYFKEVANLATEVSGRVEEVLFEEGQRLDRGEAMVRLDSSMLEADIVRARALLRQNEALLSQERARYERARELLAEEVTTPQEYDDIRFTVDSLQQRAAASRAELARLELELDRKTIRAPFEGVVVERMTEVGEWKREGDSVAVFARVDEFDVIVNIPEAHLRFQTPGSTVAVRVRGETLEGSVNSLIPRGDVATRTFPVKIRVAGQPWLFEGMSASVSIPSGEAAEALMAPRDAVILLGGRDYVFLAADGQARQVEVSVLGYDAYSAGISGEGLAAGQLVIVKGHERLRDGQAIEVL